MQHVKSMASDGCFICHWLLKRFTTSDLGRDDRWKIVYGRQPGDQAIGVELQNLDQDFYLRKESLFLKPMREDCKT
jgi:hypothetical protein